MPQCSEEEPSFCSRRWHITVELLQLMCINLSSAYDVKAKNAVHVNLCFCLSFQTRISAVKNGFMLMMSVMGT